MNRKYTNEIIAIIKEFYPKYGYKKCQKLTKLSKGIIQTLAQRYNIHKLPSNHIGEIFGRLKIIQIGSKINKNQKWLCSCDCGNQKEIFYSNLQNGDIQSCGCLHKEISHKQQFKDIIGQKFHKLLVINCAGKNKHGGYMWNCLCDCGKRKIINGMSLRNGKTKSCGCLVPHSPNSRSVRWSKKILKRDNFTCRLSGSKERVQAHHLFNVASYPELRKNLDNGITITDDLHKLFHRLYGVKNNTPKQFAKFKAKYESGEFS